MGIDLFVVGLIGVFLAAGVIFLLTDRQNSNDYPNGRRGSAYRKSDDD